MNKFHSIQDALTTTSEYNIPRGADYSNVKDRLFVREKEDILGMRKYWSRWLLVCIIVILAFDMFVVLSIGYNWMSFSKEYLIPVFVGESMLKIAGLALIVVRFLFKE